MKLLCIFLLGAVFAAAQTCTSTVIPLAGSVDGTLEASDCAVRDYIVSSSSTRRADAWKITVPDSKVFKIRMSGPVLDPLVFVVDINGQAVAADDNTGGGKDAEVLIQLTAGAWTVIATSATTTLGDYKIDISSEAPRSCTPTSTLDLDASVEADFKPTDCRLADIVPLSAGGAFLNNYRITVPRTLIMTVEMTSTTVAPFILLGRTDGVVLGGRTGAIGKSARAKFSLSAGTYILLASTTSPQTGAYTIRTQTEDRRNCQTQSVLPGAVITGNLEDSDCRYLDMFLFQSDEAYVDAFSYEVKQGSLATISMKSATLDTYLELLDSTPRIIAGNDDVSASDLNSEVRLSLAPGIYTIVASDIEALTGSYQLTLNSESLRDCPAQKLDLAGTTSGSLQIGQCRFLDIVQPSSINNPASAFAFTVASPKVVTLSGAASGWSPSLQLRNSDRLISSTGSSSGFSILLTPGDYKLIATHAAGSGEFRLTAASRDPLTCQPFPLAFASDASATLGNGGCELREILPFSQSATKADAWKLDVVTAGSITVQVSSEAFPPLVLILDQDGKIVAQETNVTLGSSVTARWSASPGTYRVLVLTVAASAGDYRIRATVNPTSVTP